MADGARQPVYNSALLVALRPVQAHPMDFFGRYSGNGRLIRQGTRADIPRKENVSGRTVPLRGDYERDGLGSPAVLQGRGTPRVMQRARCRI